MNSDVPAASGPPVSLMAFPTDSLSTCNKLIITKVAIMMYTNLGRKVNTHLRKGGEIEMLILELGNNGETRPFTMIPFIQID